ncbi:putative small secreted protein [Oceanisphaera litoralis]|nr:entericidin A/B family lipoprotein [Oceanisphaera litoralis]MBM7456393.1 putative small secreted protein [Oceanisphaera litoralis]
MFKKLMMVLMAAGLTVGLYGCNTFAGAGKDIQQGGEAVEDAARDVQSSY